MGANFKFIFEIERGRNVENNSRRNFLKIASYTLGGTLAAGVAVPVVGLAIHPWMKETVFGTEDFIAIGTLEDFPVGLPKKITITSSKMDAWNIFDGLVMGSVWVVRSGDNALRVFSVNCPHLGCGVNWGEDVKQFLCPCHEGVFDINGKKLSGPSPRDMYSYETKIENNTILLNYKRLV